MSSVEKSARAAGCAKLRNSTTVFLVGNIEPTMEWYKQLGFDSEYYPPGFAILRRDEVEIFLQQQPKYVPPDDPGRGKRQAWNVYIVTDDVKALYEEYSALPGVQIGASALPAGLRDDGVRRDGSERSPTGVRPGDTEVIPDCSRHTNNSTLPLNSRVRSLSEMAIYHHLK